MSNFICEKCGKPCFDSPLGYVTGCEHYPPDMQRLPPDMETMQQEKITKMRTCSHLLPDPGGEVVRECLDEIERLRNATLTLLGETDDSEYMTAKEREQFACKTLSV